MPPAPPADRQAGTLHAGSPFPPGRLIRPVLLIALSILALLPSCAHRVQTTSRPLHGIVRTHTGRPVAGARVWAYFTLPGGVWSPPGKTAFGPAITGPDGRFTLPMRPVTMVQHHSAFDGNPCPQLVIVHKSLGAFGRVNLEEQKEPPFLTLTYPAPDRHSSVEYSFRIIDTLPPEANSQARAYLGEKAPPGQ